MSKGLAGPVHGQPTSNRLDHTHLLLFRDETGVHPVKAAADWQSPRFHVTFDRVAAAAVPQTEAAPPVVPRLKLTIMKGTAAQRAFVFTGGRIDVGRRAEVL